MIRLDATTKTVQLFLSSAVVTTQPTCMASYSDKLNTTYTGGSNLLAANSTSTITLIAAPAANTVRDVDWLNVYNGDSAFVNVTVQYNNNGTTYPMTKVTLPSSCTLCWAHAGGWRVLDSGGRVVQAS